MINKERFKLLIPISLFHTMAHIYPYLLPVLCLVIREDIVMNYTQTALLSMTGVLVTIPLTIVFGFIGDRIIKWRLELVVVGFLVVFSHSFIIYAAQTYAILILAAVVGGIGASVFHPISLPMLSQEFGAERNLALSINLIFGTFGSIITPIVSISLSSWLGWRSTSLIFGIAGVVLLPILTISLLLGKKQIQYNPEADSIKNEIVVETTKNSKRNNKSIKKLAFITGPFIALVLAQIIRAGTFRIINTFTAFIFEDRFGASELKSALIMSIILGCGGIAALISGFVSARKGSLRTFLFAKSSTVLASIFVIIFVGYFAVNSLALGVPSLLFAIFLFIFLVMSFYFGSPSSNALFAEMVPQRVLSSTFGIVNALTTGFSAMTPVIFGAIVDQGFTFPYEYFLLFLFSIIPLGLLFYVKKKIGLKTPEEVEVARQKGVHFH